ncbi:MAG: histidine phosphatase family protein [Halomonas sp. BM-2019]|nr:MAG: histidine phosphatase family protein [Halomonas sp. BM-2019]
MRHGHSQANARGLIVSSPERGLAGFGLSPEGGAQLEALLADWRWPVPTGIVHSDFRRTTETAARVAARFGLALAAEPGLRERHFGELEGQGDHHYPEVWARDAESAEHRAFGVEPLTAVAERMGGVIAGLEARHQGETLLLVSHGDPLQILLTALVGRPLTRHREGAPLAPASITPYPG